MKGSGRTHYGSVLAWPMTCPHCSHDQTRDLRQPTKLGYRRYCCGGCGRTFNERTGAPYNFLEFPSDIVLLVVLWRLRYNLTLRDLSVMFLERGFTFTHEAVREWEARFAPLLAEELRKRRSGKRGRKWHVDETYLKVKGKWCYLVCHLNLLTPSPTLRSFEEL